LQERKLKGCFERNETGTFATAATRPITLQKEICLPPLGNQVEKLETLPVIFIYFS
jgi:hypothetical protein